MLKTLKRRLTFVCSLTTTIIITVITLIALSFSEKQLTARRQISLQNALFNVIQQLQSQSLSYSWLAQIETNNEIIVHIYSEQSSLSFPGCYILGDEREQLLQTACERLDTTYSLSELPVSFDFKQNKGHYLVLYTSVPSEDIMYRILLIQDLKHSDEQIRFLRLFFCILIIIGSIFLGLFSFWFVCKAVKPIEISQKEQNDFIAAASHEMRSPLAVIRASTDNLLEDVAIQNNKYINVINKECTQLTRFVNDLLFLANTDCGHWRTTPHPTELDTFLLEVYDSFLPLVSQKEYSLDIKLPDEKQPKVMIDPERITQVLSILINNALAYTPVHTKIILSLVNTRDYAIISVADNGPGIPEHTKKHIFKRFYRGDSSRHASEHYGLGLSIAYEIMKQHYGRITVEDTLGGGTTFKLLLPLSADKLSSTNNPKS